MAFSPKRPGEDIVPDEFMHNWEAKGAETIEEALTMAEQETKKIALRKAKRCDTCRSASLIKKTKKKDFPHMRPEGWKCPRCGSHTDDPLPPIDEMDGPKLVDDKRDLQDLKREAGVQFTTAAAATGIEKSTIRTYHRYTHMWVPEKVDRLARYYRAVAKNYC